MATWQVTADADDARRGCFTGPLFEARCALGRGGLVAAERGREGDGATPMGLYPLRRVFYRPDKVEKPVTNLWCEALQPTMGWCDDPADPHYNRLVSLPFGPSHEKLWRSDDLYDLILVPGHNDAPVVPGLGSAIFVHVARFTDVSRHDFRPTQGCVALERSALTRLLRLLQPDDMLAIG